MNCNHYFQQPVLESILYQDPRFSRLMQLSRVNRSWRNAAGLVVHQIYHHHNIQTKAKDGVDRISDLGRLLSEIPLESTNQIWQDEHRTVRAITVHAFDIFSPVPIPRMDSFKEIQEFVSDSSNQDKIRKLFLYLEEDFNDRRASWDLKAAMMGFMDSQIAIEYVCKYPNRLIAKKLIHAEQFPSPEMFYDIPEQSPSFHQWLIKKVKPSLNQESDKNGMILKSAIKFQHHRLFDRCMEENATIEVEHFEEAAKMGAVSMLKELFDKGQNGVVLRVRVTSFTLTAARVHRQAEVMRWMREKDHVDTVQLIQELDRAIGDYDAGGCLVMAQILGRECLHSMVVQGGGFLMVYLLFLATFMYATSKTKQ